MKRARPQLDAARRHGQPGRGGVRHEHHRAPKTKDASFREKQKVKSPQANEPRKAWPKQGALTPSLLELYASVAGMRATVTMADGSEVSITDMSMTPVRKETRLASLMSDFGLPLPLLGVLPPPVPEDLEEGPYTKRSPDVSALQQLTGSNPLALYNAVLGGSAL